MRSLKDNVRAVVDITVVIGVGILFAGLMVIAYLVWEMNDQFATYSVKYQEGDGVASGSAEYYNMSMRNVTAGFDNAINLILVAVTIMILAIAISALLLLRRGR